MNLINASNIKYDIINHSHKAFDKTFTELTNSNKKIVNKSYVYKLI